MYGLFVGMLVVFPAAQVVTDPGAPQIRIPKDQVAWLRVANDKVISLWGDGQVVCHSLSNGERLSSFVLEDYEEHGVTQSALALLPLEKPSLLFLTVDQLDNSLRLFDIASGKQTGEISLPRAPGVQIVGMSRDSRALYCADQTGGDILEVDLVAKRVVWRRRNPDAVLAGTVASTDGALFVNCTVAGAVVARKRDGGIAWKREGFVRGVPQPLGNSGAPQPVLVLGDETPCVFAVAFQTGETVWKRNVKSVGDFLAISADGKAQAFWRVNHVEVLHLPEEGREAVKWHKGRPEALFTPDGRRLVLCPALNVVAVSGERDVETLQRELSSVMVFDLKTKELHGPFALDK